MANGLGRGLRGIEVFSPGSPGASPAIVKSYESKISALPGKEAFGLNLPEDPCESPPRSALIPVGAGSSIDQSSLSGRMPGPSWLVAQSQVALLDSGGPFSQNFRFWRPP